MNGTAVLEKTQEQFPEKQWFLCGELPGGGSDRRYFRLQDEEGTSLVVMYYTDARPDNLKFVSSTKVLSRLGVSAPKIFSEEEGLLWMSDLGDQTLYLYRQADWEGESLVLYQGAIKEVAKLHNTTAGDLSNEEEELLEPPFDRALYKWEQEYFFEHFLEGELGLSMSEIESYRHNLVGVIDFLEKQKRGLVHRDFQSQNVMIAEDKQVVLIDYQGLRWGVSEYDIASLLWDPYVCLEADKRNEMISFYKKVRGLENDSQFDERLRLCVGQRLMQALGAYGNLSRNLGKLDYKKYRKPALELLLEVASEQSHLESLLAISVDDVKEW